MFYEAFVIQMNSLPDIYQAYQMIDQVIEDLKYFRKNINHEFDHWSSMAQKMITAVRERKSKPRTTKFFQHLEIMFQVMTLNHNSEEV